MFNAHKDCHDEINLLNSEIVKLKTKVSSMDFNAMQRDLEMNHSFQRVLNNLSAELDVVKDWLNLKYVDGRLIPIKKCESCHQEIKGETK